jgi:hypothetical protein
LSKHPQSCRGDNLCRMDGGSGQSSRPQLEFRFEDTWKRKLRKLQLKTRY